jgi:hypothetical protein
MVNESPTSSRRSAHAWACCSQPVVEDDTLTPAREGEPHRQRRGANRAGSRRPVRGGRLEREEYAARTELPAIHRMIDADQT